MLNSEGLTRSRWSLFADLFTFAAKGDESGGSDDELDDDEDDEEDDDEDEDAGKDEATLRAELKASRAALVAAKGTSTKAFAKRRELKGELARVTAALANAGTKPKDDDDEDRPDTAAQIAAARSEGVTSGDARAIKVAARAALKDAGAGTDDLGDLVRLLDLDEVDLDDDGNTEGLEEQIASLKARRPALFGTRGKRRRISGDNSGDDRKKAPDTRTPSELQAASLLGG